MPFSSICRTLNCFRQDVNGFMRHVGLSSCFSTSVSTLILLSENTLHGPFSQRPRLCLSSPLAVNPFKNSSPDYLFANGDDGLSARGQDWRHWSSFSFFHDDMGFGMSGQMIQMWCFLGCLYSSFQNKLVSWKHVTVIVLNVPTGFLKLGVWGPQKIVEFRWFIRPDCDIC